jgi:hypothetical protein
LPTRVSPSLAPTAVTAREARHGEPLAGDFISYNRRKLRVIFLHTHVIDGLHAAVLGSRYPNDQPVLSKIRLSSVQNVDIQLNEAMNTSKKRSLVPVCEGL